MMVHGYLVHRGPSPGVAAFIGFTAQAKLAKFKSAEGVRDKRLLGRGVLALDHFLELNLLTNPGKPNH